MAFKLPIEYEPHTPVDDSIINNIDFDTLYKKTFKPETKLGENQLKKWYKQFSSDKQFLKKMQQLQKHTSKLSVDHSKINVFVKEFGELTAKQDFLSSYQFLDFKYFQRFNKNEHAMQLLSIYNIMSPLINLVTPLVVLILPFFILKTQNREITFQNYKDFLFSTIFRKYNIEGFMNSSLQNKLYILMTMVFYFIGLYQNIVSSIKFYKNNKYIQSFFKTSQEFLSYVCEEQDKLLPHLSKFKEFKSDIQYNNQAIQKILQKLTKINNMQLGKKMTLFHRFKFDEELIQTCQYGLDYIAFVDNLKNVSSNKQLNICRFSNTKTVFKEFYSPLIETKELIKNSCNLSKNYIISGPNASGKTTVLKSILSNIILSQQIGRGFYTDSLLKPYDFIHCYLNIPDTNNRDSLFQAEARQCKNIIDIISENNDKEHFVIFDELYSGTNPDQAVQSAYSYLQYLGKMTNTSFLLTTHFYELCSKFNKSENIINISMKSKYINDKHTYFYKLQKGVSKMKSGIEILEQLNYPSDITDTLKYLE